DKVADQISDSILDEFLAFDAKSKVACETLVTTGLVVVAGEVKSQHYVDVQEVVRNTINRIGYTKGEYRFDGNSCGVMSAIHEQSPDINQGVEAGKGLHKEQGAGDQGMMFGYACKDTDEYMPLPLYLAHSMLQILAEIRKKGKEMKYLRPDAKSQFTIEYDEKNNPVRIDTIVLSTQHDDFDSDENKMLEKIRTDVQNIVLPRLVKQLPARTQKLFKGDYTLHVNPTGKFVIGGPHGDTGLTGRKIIVDTYGGKGAHGGGAFSGKDPSKVDRSAAYAARHIAKNLVAAGVADEVLIQVAYAIGVAEPVGVYVNTYGTAKVKDSDGEIAKKVEKIFPLTPSAIQKRLKLLNPIYAETASYGHFGRKPQVVTKTFKYEGKEYTKEVELFTWEKLDYIDKVRKAFGI
ncbi:MAG: methionine adenosyltransferase, partial [Bacteroidales bacterium]|nr:methionine adenosyltransferase [Bacteroidales bacterium]